MNAVSQDAFLGRGTHSPYLDILNHIGLFCDENAPTGVSDEFMRVVGPDSTVRRFEGEVSALQAELQTRYGKPSMAPVADQERYDRKVSELRAARQKHRRNVEGIIRTEYFKKKNDDELERQLCGVHGPQQPSAWWLKSRGLIGGKTCCSRE